MSEEITPAMAAFARHHERVAGSPLRMPDSWDMQPPEVRADWEATAAAAIDRWRETTADWDRQAAEPEPAKVIIVTEQRGALITERRYTADSFDADSSGLDVKRDGRVIAAYPGEHSWLSVREDGASTGDPYFTQGKKLALALDALREMREHGDEAASEALAQIEDVDL